MPIPQFIQVMLKQYSKSELINGTKVNRPTRIDKRSEKNWSFKVELRPKFIAPPNLSKSTIKNLLSGKTKNPTPKTIHEFKKFKNRVMYHKLRAAGARTDDAKLYYRRSDAEDKLKDFLKYSHAIADAKQADYTHVAYGLSISGHHYNYWDQYVKAKGYEIEYPEDDWEDDTYYDD